MPNAEKSDGDQRQLVYDLAQVAPAIFGVSTRAMVSTEGELGQGREAAELCSPGHSEAWLVTISVLVL
jgi:hypothetical protein